MKQVKIGFEASEELVERANAWLPANCSLVLTSGGRRPSSTSRPRETRAVSHAHES
jgi:hypothetical protein